MAPKTVRAATQDDLIRLVNGIVRGDVLLVDLSGAKGREIKKAHFCVVVSNDVLNRNTDTLVVVPLTTHGGKGTARAYEVPLAKGDGDLERDGAAVPHQVRTIDARERVLEIWGRLPGETMTQIDEMLYWVASDA